MQAEVIANVNNGNVSHTVTITGMKELLKFLQTSDPKMRKALQDGMKDAANPVLMRARANAKAIADKGTYHDSLAIRANGANIRLTSTDVAAPVKEFAKPGAVYAPKKTDKRANARAMKTFPVGVPKRANPPRVMWSAAESSIEEVADRIDTRIEQVLGSVNNG